jgi:hypothetical protein
VPRMRTIIALAILLGIAGYFLAELLRSDESKIRRAIEGAAADLNAGRSGGVVAILADDFRDASSGATKREIHAYLAGIFLSQQNRHDGAFRYPATIAPDSWRITVDGDTASAALTAHFEDAKSSEGGVVWEIELEVNLERRDGAWRIVRSKHETSSGRPPF